MNSPIKSCFRSSKLIYLVLLFIIVLIKSNTVNGLFEDQAGTYDWRRQLVGKPIYTHIDSGKNRIYVATDLNVLAAINVNTGNIAWRKIFETNLNGKIDHVIWAPKEILVVSGNGQKVQAFSYKHGFATFEYNLFNMKTDTVNSNKANIFGIESKQEADSYYFTNGFELCYVSLKDKACVDLPSDGGYVYKHMFENDQGFFIVGVNNNQIQKIQFNSLLTSILSKTNSPNTQNLAWLNKDTNCIKSTESNQLICDQLDSMKLFASSIKSGNTLEFTELNIEDKTLFSEQDKPALIWSFKESYLIQTIAQANNLDYTITNLFLFTQQGSGLKLVKKLESIAQFDIINNENSNFYLITAKYTSVTKLAINGYDLKNGQERTDLTSSLNINQKEFKSVLQLKSRWDESKSGMNTVCLLEDYSITVFNQQGTKYFTREEALAYIVSVEMVDFPLLHLQEEFEDEFGASQQDNLLSMFFKRIRTQVIQLREFITVDLYTKLFNLINKNNLKTSSGSDGFGLSAEEITRDEFNLNKLIVAATSVGKVFGIYTSANGKILWSFYLKNTKPFEFNKLKKETNVPLFLQRTAAHFPYEPQCALVSKLVDKNSNTKTLVYYFNPLTGQASRDQPKEGFVFDYQIKQAFLSHTVDAHFIKPIVLFDTENKLHILPESSSEELTLKSSKQNVIYTTSFDNDKVSSLIGYSMKYTNKPLPELWKVNIEDEAIIAIGSKLHNDRIHSHGKVLGDRSVLYKYLNPNLIGVVTTGQDSQKVPFINVYLIDTVTGSIINSFNHKRCRGPVNIVHSENWFFYSYYSIKYRRFEVTSIELFEGSNQFNSTHFSSLDDIKPVVYSKSYIVQKNFDAMQITITEKGISTKDIIVATQFGVIIEIPWIFIDPRRPMKMTEVEREENLLPYMPEIPLNYEFSLNYYNYVYNIRGITTAPSGLESTSLVFAYGLDIFFTRVFPSKTFDMLREDFDYFFISTLMVGLLLGTVLSKKLASSSNLKKAWK